MHNFFDDGIPPQIKETMDKLINKTAKTNISDTGSSELITGKVQNIICNAMPKIHKHNDLIIVNIMEANLALKFDKLSAQRFCSAITELLE